MPFETTWMKLEDTMLSEISQREKRQKIAVKGDLALLEIHTGHRKAEKKNSQYCWELV